MNPLLIYNLIHQAALLGGEDLCAGGHNWISVGGRACPKDGIGEYPGCSQNVYVCSRCGLYDYGEEGGPAYFECFVECRYEGE